MTTLITGASRGIGAGLARRFAQRGEEVLGTATAPTGGDLLPLDLRDPGSIAALAASLTGRPIDLLVCNAGVYLDKGHGLDTGYGADLWAETFAVNVTGTFRCIQSLLPNLRAAPAGRIAILSSQMASDYRAPGGSYIYRASKAAVLNLGRNLATDLRAEGIAVGIYEPGWLPTDMGGPAASDDFDTVVDGLVARCDDLTVANSGSFLSWHGGAHPY